MASPDKGKNQEMASPSTPRAHVQKGLHPAASQPIAMQLDPSHTTNGQSEDAFQSDNLDGLQRPTEADSRKEVWKKRKQM